MNKIIQAANILSRAEFRNAQNGRIYSIDGISPCLDTMSGGDRQPKIMVVI